MTFFSKSNSVKILNEIEKELEEIIYGSIEIYVNNREVTQISVRKIQKTNLGVKENKKERKDNQLPDPQQAEHHELKNKTDVKMGLDK